MKYEKFLVVFCHMTGLTRRVSQVPEIDMTRLIPEEIIAVNMESKTRSRFLLFFVIWRGLQVG